MHTPMISEILIRERQRELEQAAGQYWQLQELRSRPRRRMQLRAGAGWMLVRVGARLADLDPSFLTEVDPVVS